MPNSKRSILKGTCKYITKPLDLLRRKDIPKDSPVWWRYDMLLALCWERTKAEYGNIELSNADLADLWETNEETARDGLTQMRNLKIVETYQVGRTGRMIRLLFAWRGQGKDSAPATNQPEERDLRLEDQVPATGVPTRKVDPESFVEGAGQTTTLAGRSNVVVACTSDLAIDLSKQQQIFNPGCTAREVAGQTTIPAQTLALLDRIEIAEPNRSAMAILEHVQSD